MRIGYDFKQFYEEKSKLPKPDGKHCVICNEKLPKYKKKYCSNECYEDWLVRINIRDWIFLRAKHLEKNPKCIICGENRAGELEVDHILPISKGGEEFDSKNLQTLCKNCHQTKTLKDFRWKCPFDNLWHDKGSKIYMKHSLLAKNNLTKFLKH